MSHSTSHPPTTSPTPPPEPIWRLSIEQYHAMIRSGILTDDDPVELLEGWLIHKMPKNPQHRLVTRLIRAALEQRIPAGWYVDSQEPITIADSEPEPDVMVVRGTTRDYADRHPSPQEVALVVEISDTTLKRDRGIKQNIYARSGIPIYWLVNLPERRIEVYTAPASADPSAEPKYTQRQNYSEADEIPVAIAGKEMGAIAVASLLS